MNNKSTYIFIAVIFFFFFSITYPQTNRQSVKFYENLWAKVDSLERSGLTRSALEIVEKIYNASKKNNVHQQFIKSVLFKLKFANYIEENSQVKIVNQVKKEIKEASFPSNAILKSILADMFWQFYKDNRYKFQQRTETVNFENEDFQTWDLNRIVREIAKYYLGSVEEAEKLQKIKLKEIKEILINYDLSDAELRPTLYDILANKALTFFINEESSLTQPVYKFILESENDLGIDTNFIKNKYVTKDSLSLKFYAIQLYQKLISFHLASNNKEALLDVDIARLIFVLRNSINRNKNNFYYKTLTYLAEKYKENPNSSLVCFYLAKYYNEEGKKYDPDVSDEFKWQTKQAIDICDSIILKYPDTQGATNCYNLKLEILSRSLSIQIEDANLPEEPFRVLVSYKNIKKLFFRISILNDSLEAKEDVYYQEKFLNLFEKESFIEDWMLELPDNSDYQMHSTEILIPALPVGKYLIMAGTDSSFSFQKNGVAYCKTWVTNISFIKRQTDEKNLEIMTLNRKTGETVSDVKIDVYYYSYMPDIRQYKYIKCDSGKTSNAGLFYFDLSTYPYSDYKIILKK